MWMIGGKIVKADIKKKALENPGGSQKGVEISGERALTILEKFATRYL